MDHVTTVPSKGAFAEYGGSVHVVTQVLLTYPKGVASPDPSEAFVILEDAPKSGPILNLRGGKAQYHAQRTLNQHGLVSESQLQKKFDTWNMDYKSLAAIRNQVFAKLGIAFNGELTASAEMPVPPAEQFGHTAF